MKLKLHYTKNCIALLPDITLFKCHTIVSRHTTKKWGIAFSWLLWSLELKEII